MNDALSEFFSGNISFGKIDQPFTIETSISGIKSVEQSDSNSQQPSSQKVSDSTPVEPLNFKSSKRFSLEEIFLKQQAESSNQLVNSRCESRRHSLQLNPLHIFKLGLKIQNSEMVSSKNQLYIKIYLCKNYPCNTSEDSYAQWQEYFVSPAFYLEDKVNYQIKIDEEDLNLNLADNLVFKVEVWKNKGKSKPPKMKLSDLLYYNELKHKKLAELSFFQYKLLTRKRIRLLVSMIPVPQISAFRPFA